MATAQGGSPTSEKRKNEIVKKESSLLENSTIIEQLSEIVGLLTEVLNTLYFVTDQTRVDLIWTQSVEMKMTTYAKQLSNLTFEIKEMVSEEEEVVRSKLLPQIQALDKKHSLCMHSLALTIQKPKVMTKTQTLPKVSTIPYLISEVKSIHEKIKQAAKVDMGVVYTHIPPFIYFSDLPEDKLMALFSEGPLPRFELRAVDVMWYNKDLAKHAELSGFIKAAECPESLELKPQCGFNHVGMRTLNVSNCHCSISASSSVHIHAKFYLTTPKVDDDDDYHHYEVKDKISTEKEEVSGELELADDVLESFRLCDGLTARRRFFGPYGGNYDDDDSFEVYTSIDLSETAKRPFGGSGSHIYNGEDGSLKLFYVALKYTVEAVMEIELVTCNEEKVAANVSAALGNFDDDPSWYESILGPDVFVEPGKLNLMRSVFHVPARCCLLIVVSLYLTSGTLKWIREFYVPLNATSSVYFLEGDDCALKLKIDWKLPHDIPALFS